MAKNSCGVAILGHVPMLSRAKHMAWASIAPENLVKQHKKLKKTKRDCDFFSPSGKSQALMCLLSWGKTQPMLLLQPTIWAVDFLGGENFGVVLCSRSHGCRASHAAKNNFGTTILSHVHGPS